MIGLIFGIGAAVSVSAAVILIIIRGAYQDVKDQRRLRVVPRSCDDPLCGCSKNEGSRAPDPVPPDVTDW